MHSDLKALTFRDLEYVVAVAQEQSFSKAARKCHVSQPALSIQIKKVEELLGLELFAREHKNVHVTPAGRSIIKQCRELLERAEHLYLLAERRKSSVVGRLLFGVDKTLAQALIGPLSSTLSRVYKEAHFEITEGSHYRLVEQINEGELDFALLPKTRSLATFETRHLIHEEVVLVVPKVHPLATRKRVYPRDLQRFPLVLPSQETHLGQFLADNLEREGLSDDKILSEDSTSLESLVATAIGRRALTVIPVLSLALIKKNYPGICTKQLSTLPSREIVFAWRRDFDVGHEFEMFVTALEASL